MDEATSTRDELRGRIAAAAAELLEQGGAAALTTRAVAAAAGVQAPTIYRLFGDKDGLLEAVAEQVMAAYVAGKAATVAAAVAAGTDPVVELRAGWLTQVRFGIDHPELYALMSDPARGRRSAAAQAGWQVLRERVARVAAAGRLRMSETRAVGMLSAAGNGAVLATLVRPPAERDPGLPEAMWDATATAMFADPVGRIEQGGGALVAAVTLRAAAAELPALSGGERVLLAEWLDRVVTDLADPVPAPSD